MTIWVDCKSENLEKLWEKLEKLLASLGLRHTIVDVCELMEVRGDK